MTQPAEFSFTRYLAAKQTVDDRALHQGVWDALWALLPSSSRQKPLAILEMGCGTGTMIGRILRSNRLSQAWYTAVDNDPANITTLRSQLDGWAHAKPHFIILPHTADIITFLQTLPEEEQYDLIIAHAFLDLLDLAEILPLLHTRLRPSGLLYATINFDGETILEPESSHGRVFDQAVISAYHATMDARTKHGRETGRRLLHQLPQNGLTIQHAGSSDWLVYPNATQQYPADEAYFLHHILHFFANSLQNDPTLPPAQLQHWLSERHQQINDGQLIYIAHQLDILAQKSGQ
jgi:SAM-dependent methyltransferase